MILVRDTTVTLRGPFLISVQESTLNLMPKLKKEVLYFFVVFFIDLTFSPEYITIFFAARLSSLYTYEVITIDNFEQNHKKYNCYERTKKTPLPQKFSHLQFGDRLDEYIGLVSYRVNCHLNIVVPKKT